MRESIGQTYLINIIMIFIIVYVCFIAIAINYSTAFRVKNNIISIIEEYETLEKAEDSIIEYISSTKYYNNSIDTINITDCDKNNSNYCIIPYETDTGATKYKVTVYLKFDFPIVGNILQFPISGETKALEYYEGSVSQPDVTPEQEEEPEEEITCTNDTIEFLGWKPKDSFCKNNTVNKDALVTASYRKCINNSWRTATRSVSPASVVENGDSYIFTYTFDEENVFAVPYTKTVKKSSCEPKEPTLTCDFSISSSKLTLNYYSELGLKQYGITTLSTPVYNYLNAKALKSGSKSINLKASDTTTYYGYVKDIKGNTATCNSLKIKSTKSKTVTTTSPCSVQCDTRYVYSGGCEYGGASGCGYTAVPVYCPSTCTTTSTVYYCDSGYTKLNNSYCIESSNITLNWNENGGTAIDDGTCTYLGKLTLPSASKRNGYEFNGWKLANGTIKKAGDSVSSGCNETYTGAYSGGTSTSITAQWCKKCNDVENGTCKLDASTAGKCKYTTTCNKNYYLSSGKGTYNPVCTDKNTITLDWNESGGTTVENGTCTVKGELSLPSAPTKDGYTFAGWKLADGTIKGANEIITGGCVKKYIGVTSGISSAITAQWTKKEITIDYNEDGGTAVSNSTCNYKSKLTLTKETPTKDGYTFNGWTLADGTVKASGTSIDSGCQSNYLGVVSDTSTSITAKWCKNCSEVENGTCKLNAKTAGKCTYTTTCNKGYYVSSGNATADPICSLTSEITVDYNENGGSTVSNGTCEFNSTLTLPSAPTKDNYTFTGWKLADGTISNAGSTVSCNKKTLGVTSGLSSNKITAQWTKNVITINYNSNGGSSVGSTSCNYGDTLKITKEVPTRDGYTFNGWQLLTGEVLKSGATKNKACVMENLGVDSGSANSITAIWCHNCNNIENGTCKLSTSTIGVCKYTTTCNSGYHSDDGGSYDSTCVLNTITIDWNENSGDKLDNSTCTYTGDLILPIPSRKGYTFTGWKLANNKVTTETKISGGCNKTNLGVDKGSTTKITAQWKKN